jgi:hypothetical protein
MVISAVAAALALLAAVGALLLAWGSRRRSRQRVGDLVAELDQLLTDLAERLRVALEPLVAHEQGRSPLWLAFDLDELLARLAQEAAQRTAADAAAAQVRGIGTGHATATFGSESVARLLESTFPSADRLFRAMTITWSYPPVVDADEDVFRSAVVVPIVEDGVETGALAGYARAPGVFHTEHVHALERLAEEAASGISTARRLTTLALKRDPRRSEAAQPSARAPGDATP